ncbi:hypothetical protein PCASD_07119 [Puccinia coronata f. sp. avenae]|uniref:Uncharacterized protein n=1 Tax=Puccinia coronata f. sp. avenae TaxID=200324 RepID=A0A2N5V4A2_9BASI|nr:hypothetical protein PCASD_07119 [Puccinia coronata f. sp. avenae]
MSPSETRGLAHDAGKRNAKGKGLRPKTTNLSRFKKAHPYILDPAKSLPTFIEQAGFGPSAKVPRQPGASS